MADNSFVNATQLNSALTETAAAIKTKTGSTAKLTWNMTSGFSTPISNIVTLSEGTANDTATAGDILSGKTAHVKGALVTGTIATKTSSNMTVSGKTVTAPAGYYASNQSKSVAVGTVTSGTASITSLTKTYNTTNGNFNITGSANVSAPTVGTAGYVSSSEGTKNAKSGGATVSATIAKIVGSTTITGATTKKPSITKRDVPSGVTQAASGNATTTAPTSGVYVAVKSDANTGTLTATPGVTTEGYGTADYHGIVANTATVGAQASDTTYVPITTTSASVSGKTVSYGSGWITAGSKSVANGAITASVSSNSGGSASMAATGFTASATATSYYVTLSTSAGSVKAKATVNTEGYVTSSNTTETSATSVSVSGNGNKVYIPVASPTFSATPTGGSTASSSTASISNSTNNSGVSIQTAYSINAVAINYAAAVKGMLNKTANAATGSNTTAKSSTNGTLYYINGVTMATPSSGSRTFTVTAPSGGTNHTYTFTQTAAGRTSIKVDNTLTMQWNDSTQALDFIYT